ncbi:MAG: hypothetical protein LBF89_12675 [Bacteroidales bacterium]|jgi:hypothetical protein|nr:hypothetical protein [Bacteroidales bacterium]
MKKGFRIIVFFAVVAVVLLDGCRKGSDEVYEPRVLVTDVTQAYLYYYMVFREAENAWALVHENGYVSGQTAAENGRSVDYRLSEGSKGIISVEFDRWQQHTATLSGTMTVDLPVERDSYRQNGRVTVSLSGFSINGQQVTGFSTITYSGSDEIDQYNYSLTEASVYSKDGEQILITSSLSGGRFQRVAGSATIAVAEDDSWIFNGTMSGILRNRSDLRYSNTVDNDYWLLYEWGCSRKAMYGYCRLTAGGRTIDYRCGASCDSEIEVKTLTQQ